MIEKNSNKILFRLQYIETFVFFYDGSGNLQDYAVLGVVLATRKKKNSDLWKLFVGKGHKYLTQ